MQAVVVRHVLSPALLPGATGRADTCSGLRAAVVAELAARLAETQPGPGDGGAPVVVVAPARWSRIAVDARPDLAALGLDVPASQRGHAGQRRGTAGGTHDRSDVGRDVRGADERPALDVTATVAVTLLRMAGWDGPVETVEIAAPTADVDGSDLDTVLDAIRDGRRLVVLALGSADAELPAGARPALAAGHARVRGLADRLVPVGTVGPGGSGDSVVAAGGDVSRA